MNKTSNTLAPEIKKIVQEGKNSYFVEELGKLSGKNWYREVKTISHKMGLNANELIHKVADSLENALNGKEIKKDLEGLKKYYQDNFQEFEEEIFEKSEKVVDAISHYLEKAKDNIMSIMLEGPEAKQKLIQQHKSILDKSSPNKLEKNFEKEKEHTGNQEIETNSENQVISILNNDTLSDQGKIDLISENFRTQYEMQRMSWKKFADVFELNQDYKKLFNKDMSVKILQNLFLLKHNPIDQNARRFLDNMMDPTLYKTDSENQQVTGPKVIGTVDLSKLPSRTQKQSKSEKTEPELFMQEPTTDSLNIVGKRMSLDTFLGAAGMDYEQILEHIKDEDPIPARYLSHNEKFKGKFSDKFDMHFFTIGQEDKGNGNTPLINVSILVPKEKRFHEGEIYKIRLKNIDAPKDSPRSQTRNIRGDLVVDFPEVVGSGAPIAENVDPKMLLELKSKFQNN